MVGELNWLSLATGGYDRGAQSAPDSRRFTTVTGRHDKRHVDIQLDDARSSSIVGTASCSQRCRSPDRVESERFEFRRRLRTGRATPTSGLLPTGWSGNIEKRLLAEHLSLFPMLPENLPRFFLMIYSVRGSAWSMINSQPMIYSIAGTRIGMLCFWLLWTL